MEKLGLNNFIIFFFRIKHLRKSQKMGPPYYLLLPKLFLYFSFTVSFGYEYSLFLICTVGDNMLNTKDNPINVPKDSYNFLSTLDIVLD